MITALPRPFCTEGGIIVIAIAIRDDKVYWITNDGAYLRANEDNTILALDWVDDGVHV